MNDRELLELAAKAAGYTLAHGRDVTDIHPSSVHYLTAPLWKPLTNDGDALRLAVNLELDIRQIGGTTAVFYHQTHLASEHLGDALERTRRAIVRAAAEIGRALP